MKKIVVSTSETINVEAVEELISETGLIFVYGAKSGKIEGYVSYYSGTYFLNTYNDAVSNSSLSHLITEFEERYIFNYSSSHEEL